MRMVIEGEELSSQVTMATENNIAIVANADIKSVVIDRFEGNPLVIFMNCRVLDADFSGGFFRLIFVDCELDVCSFDSCVLECFQFAPFEKLSSFRTVWWQKYEGQELVQCPNYISSCSFVGAQMTRATFRDAHIRHCDFARADLSQATGIELHECVVDGARLPVPTNERSFRTHRERMRRAVEIWFGDENYKWGALLMAYTGPSFYILAFASLAYLVPPAFLLALIHYLQISKLPSAAELGLKTQSISIFSLMIGWRGSFTFEVVFKVLMWLYVIVRSAQTISVSKWRQAQLITGRTPDIKSQKRMWLTHRALRVVSVFVISYLVLTYARLLTSRINVPTYLLESS